MRSFLTSRVSDSVYWELLYLFLAIVLLMHPPLAFHPYGPAVLGGGLLLLFFRGVPTELFSKMGWVGGAFLLYVLVSAFWSFSPGFTLRSAGLLFLTVLLYMMSRQSDSASQDRVEVMLILFAMVAALMGLHQWFFGFDQLARSLPQLSGVEADELAAAVHNKRAFGPLVTSGALAAFLIFTIPQVLVRAWTASGTKRGLWSLAAFVLLAGLAATGSVGGWICLGLALAFLLYRQGLRKWLLALGAFLAFVLGSLLWYRGVHSWILASYSMRLELWHSAWLLFLQRPWFGWGLGTFGEAYQATGLPLGTGAEFAHDLPLQLLVETGLAGTLLFAAAFINVLTRFKWPARWEGWGVTGGVLAVLLFSLIDLPFQMVELTWVFAGVAGRLDFRPEGKRQLPEISLSWAPWVLLAVLAVTGFWPPYRPWNFALLAVSVWTLFSLFEAQINGLKPWIAAATFYLLLRGFDSPSASGAVWFLELAGLVAVFYLLVPRFDRSRRFLMLFASLGLLWAVKLVWYCWQEAPTNPIAWIKFQITDVEPWIFFPNPKHLAVFFIPLFFLLPGQPSIPSPIKKMVLGLSALITLRLKSMTTLVGVLTGWLWGVRRNAIKLLTGVSIIAVGLIFLRAINTSATKWGRFDIWRSVFKVWSQSPWKGVGPGVFDGAFHRFQEPQLEGVAHYLMDARYAHNEFLDLLTAFGIVGLIVVLALIWEASQDIREPEKQKALWGLASASFFDFCLHTPLISLLAVGLAAPEKAGTRKGSGLAAFLVLGLSLGLFVAPVFGPLLEKRSEECIALRDFPSALRCERAAVSLDPWNAQAVDRESELYEKFYLATQDETWRKKADDDWTTAAQLEQADGNLVFEKAKRFSERYEIHPTREGLNDVAEAWVEAEKALPLNAYVPFEEGSFWVQTAPLSRVPLWGKEGYGPRALECYRKATSLEPNFTAAWLNQGLSEEQAGRGKGTVAKAGKEDLLRAWSVYSQFKDAPGLSPEERQLVALPPGEARWLWNEVSR